MAKWTNPAKGISYRHLRVSEMLRRTLADILAEGFPFESDVPSVSITVSEVRLTSDLKKAKVYVLPLGGIRADETVEALNRERAEIRRMMNRRIHLKYSPSLHFVPDTTFDRVDEVRRLLQSEEVQRDIGKHTVAAET